MTVVALVECRDYKQIKAAISESLKHIGGIQKIVKRDSKVLVKPNLSDPIAPEKAAVTHPLFIEAVVELLQEITPNIWIAEQSASTAQGTTEQSFLVSGVNDVVKRTRCLLRNMQNEGFIPKDIPNYRVLEKTDFAEVLFDVDLVVNLPKLKSHGITYITGAVKNCYGFLHPDERQYLHKNFSEHEQFCQGVVDIYSFVMPTLTIMDAVIAMEGDEGPSYGPPREIGYVVTSTDGVAVDAIASRITGHKPMDVLTTRYAHQRKIGVGNPSKITLKGDELKQKKFEQHKSYKIRNEKSKGKLQPKITDKCELCKACKLACPNDAITETKDQMLIDVDKCIQCLCCLEVCIYEAIVLESKNGGDRNANLRLGRACNQNCLFCTVADDPEQELTTQEAKEKIRYLVSQGVNEIAFTGGEPTIRKDLVQLFKYAGENGMSRIDLQSNGVRLSDAKYLKSLKEAGLSTVLLAFHSHKKLVLEKLTDNKDYDDTLKGLKNIVAADLQLHISHVINKENYKDLVEFVDFIHKITKKAHLYFQFIRPNGNTKRHRWLVPKLSDVEVHLHMCMQQCVKQDLSFAVEGVPLCYMQGFEKHCAETERMMKQPQVYVGQGKSQHDDLHSFIHSELKTKSADCELCKLNGVCAGVWKEYAEIHGTSELFPIFHELKW